MGGGDTNELNTYDSKLWINDFILENKARILSHWIEDSQKVRLNNSRTMSEDHRTLKETGFTISTFMD